MKKRLLVGFLLFALLLQLTACIRIDPEIINTDPSTTSAEPPSNTTLPSDPSDPPPVPPVYPWGGAISTAEAFLSFSGAIVDSSKQYYTYEEMEADLASLAELYPSDYFSYRSFGKSVAGRELYVAILGNPNAPRQVMVSAGIHGREYLTPLLAMKQLEFYLRYYQNGMQGDRSYASLFEDCCFYIVPMTNPDGIMLAQHGIESLTDPALQAVVRAVYEADYRKGYTLSTNINSYLKYWKANANGVDLNRNFDALWEDYRMGEPEPCHKNYKGPSAMSEPESRALAELTNSLSGISAVLCLHSQGEVLYWNCGQDEELLHNTDLFTAALADRSGYRQVDEHNNDASYSDWCALERGLVAVTIETGTGECPLLISQFPTIWRDQFDLLPLTAKYFRE